MAKKNKNHKAEARNRMGQTGPAAAGVGQGSAVPPNWVPGTPGVLTPPVQPFQTPADSQDQSDRTAEWDSALGALDSSLKKLQAQTEYDLADNEKARGENLNTAQDNAAARGLFQSSIKDADLFDIEATSRIRKDFLNRQFDLATMDVGRQKQIINDARDRFGQIMNQRMVENAQGVNANLPPYSQQPTIGHKGPALGGVGPAAAGVAGAGPPRKGVVRGPMAGTGAAPNFGQGKGAVRNGVSGNIGPAAQHVAQNYGKPKKPKKRPNSFGSSG